MKLERLNTSARTIYYMEVPLAAVQELKWKYGDILDVDIPTTGSDLIVNKVSK